MRWRKTLYFLRLFYVICKTSSETYLIISHLSCLHSSSTSYRENYRCGMCANTTCPISKYNVLDSLFRVIQDICFICLFYYYYYYYYCVLLLLLLLIVCSYYCSVLFLLSLLLRCYYYYYYYCVLLLLLLLLLLL